jgi:hypothetical protein
MKKSLVFEVEWDDKEQLETFMKHFVSYVTDEIDNEFMSYMGENEILPYEDLETYIYEIFNNMTTTVK